MRWRGIVFLVALAMWSAGCTSWSPEDAGVAVPPSEPAVVQPVHVASVRMHDAPPPPGPLLEVSSSAFPLWTRPRNEVVANASAPEGAEVVWLASSPGGDVVPEVLGGAIYLYGPASAPARARADTGLLRPHMLSEPVRLSAEGRVTFAAPREPDVLFEVFVEEGATPGGVEVVLVRDEHGFRFVPPSVRVAPGAHVLFENDDVVVQSVVEVRFERKVADSRLARFVAVDAGWYDLVAVAHDAATGARGEASPLGVLADFEGPSWRAELGPRTGELTAVTPSETVFRYQAVYPVHVMEVRLARTGPWVSEAPNGLRLDILRDGEVAFTATTRDTASTFEIANVPPGDYAFRVTLDGSVRESYSFHGHVLLFVPPPTR